MLTGDFRKLAALRGVVADSASLRGAVQARLVEAFDEQLEHQYATGTDPSNEGWAELDPSTLARGRRPPPLTDTGEMRANSRAMGISGLSGIRVRVDKPSAPDVPLFHQEGTEWMPARPIIPEPGRPLPAAWAAAAELGAGKALEEHFRGAL